MSRCAQLAAFCLALVALPVAAEEVSVSEPLAAASLHEGALDMVAYFAPTADGAFEVTATFAPPVGHSDPMRVVMLLAEGEAASFAMPGYRGAQYHFSRSDNALTVAVAPLVQTALID